MRVDHVVIAAFLEKGDVETVDGAERLLEPGRHRAATLFGR